MEKLKLATIIQMRGQLELPGKDGTVYVESQARYQKQHRPRHIQMKGKQQLLSVLLGGGAGYAVEE